jgi:hypothetical protein
VTKEWTMAYCLGCKENITQGSFACFDLQGC